MGPRAGEVNESAFRGQAAGGFRAFCLIGALPPPGLATRFSCR